ncbi:MAG: 16S rRNA (guanine(527)-N(7))-methyltransferase RsmG [Oscillospiraceae bacterium]
MMTTEEYFLGNERLRAVFASAGLGLSDEAAEKFAQYAAILLDWNSRMNLTAITEPAEIAVKHFLDSALLTKLAEIPPGARVFDIGTGAGFPACPLKILRGDLNITLIDSLNKRVNFLKTLSDALKLDAVAIHARAEDAARAPALREKCDVATARAVAFLPALAEYCLPFVRVGGVFLAMKGGDSEDETNAAKPALKILGGQIESVQTYALPDGSPRALIAIRKITHTPRSFPRNKGMMTKNPL